MVKRIRKTGRDIKIVVAVGFAGNGNRRPVWPGNCGRRGDNTADDRHVAGEIG